LDAGEGNAGVEDQEPLVVVGLNMAQAELRGHCVCHGMFGDLSVQGLRLSLRLWPTSERGTLVAAALLRKGSVVRNAMAAKIALE
jgi:hypothetical protein